MAYEGANVVVADIAVEQANIVTSQVRATGQKAIAMSVDITKSQDANQMVKTVLDEFGRIDILVNNAGGSAREKGSLFCESTEEIGDWIVGINLKGVRNCTRAVIEHMIQRQTGKIISTASITGIVGNIGQVDYSAAKAGIIGFTKALATEVAPYKINVNCVSPSTTETERIALRLPEEVKEGERKTTLLGRLGEPEDIANMVDFLASDEANFITGQNFIVDGGRTLGA